MYKKLSNFIKETRGCAKKEIAVKKKPMQMLKILFWEINTQKAACFQHSTSENETSLQNELSSDGNFMMDNPYPILKMRRNLFSPQAKASQ